MFLTLMWKFCTAGPMSATARHRPVLTAGGKREAEIATPTRLFTFLLRRGGREGGREGGSDKEGKKTAK